MSRRLPNSRPPLQSATGSNRPHRLLEIAELSAASELMRRRVPQILGAYLLFSWGVVQFVEFLESRYQLTPHWVELIGACLLLLLPSIALLSYGHGAPGADRWSRFERVFVPANLLVAAALLLVGFSGRSFGRVVHSVSVTDEEGVRKTRLIPKGEYVRRFTSNLFENRTNEPELDWLGYGLEQLFVQDLFQDPGVFVTSAINLTNAYGQRGHDDLLHIPPPVQREVARELHSPFFVRGAFDRDGDGYRLRLELFESRSGDLVFEDEQTGPDLIASVDALSRNLRAGLEIPESYLRSMEDRSAGEMLTADMEALRFYSLGLRALVVDNDYPRAQETLTQATELDPSFCSAYFLLFAAYSNAQDLQTGSVALQHALQNLYRAPERYGFQIKMSYFMNVVGDGAKAMAVGKMWAELYPDDVAAHATLATLHQYRNEFSEAIDCYVRVLEIDPTQKNLYSAIAGLYKELGSFDQARAYLQRYLEEFPDERRAHAHLGALFVDYGRLDEAKESYERALLIEPGHVGTNLALARILEKQGDFAKAEDDFLRIAGLATSANDRMNAYAALESFYLRAGQLVKSFEYRSKRFEAAKEAQSPLERALVQAMDQQIYREWGRLDEARREIEELTSGFTGMLQSLGQIGRAWIAAQEGDRATAEPSLTEVREMIESTQLEILRRVMSETEGNLAENSSDLESALKSYQEALGYDPHDVSLRRDAGRVLIGLERFEEAENVLNSSLERDPANGETNFEMARLFLALERGEEALLHVDRALRAWDHADPEFRRAEEARRLKSALEARP